jgi:hypothetical protein
MALSCIESNTEQNNTTLCFLQIRIGYMMRPFDVVERRPLHRSIMYVHPISTVITRDTELAVMGTRRPCCDRRFVPISSLNCAPSISHCRVDDTVEYRNRHEQTYVCLPFLDPLYS